MKVFYGVAGNSHKHANSESQDKGKTRKCSIIQTTLSENIRIIFLRPEVQWYSHVLPNDSDTHSNRTTLWSDTAVLQVLKDDVFEAETCFSDDDSLGK